jgi:hypothetical protein
MAMLGKKQCKQNFGGKTSWEIVTWKIEKEMGE